MKRQLYKPLGFAFLALAMLGILLPLLPTTPFLLLAAWFFARSSPKWHRWLMASRVFGPLIRNWEDRRCISCRTKVVALTSMILVGGASVIFALDDAWLRTAGAVLMAIGAFTVLRLKTCETATAAP